MPYVVESYSPFENILPGIILVLGRTRVNDHEIIHMR